MCGCNSNPTPLPTPPADPYFPPVPMTVPGGMALDMTIPAEVVAVARGGGLAGPGGLSNGVDMQGRICSQKPGAVDPWTGQGSVNWTCCTPPAGRFKVQACVKFSRPTV